jgi:hypothetical protein
MAKTDSLKIRNSTAEFLIFTNQAEADGIEVRVQDNTVWLTQKLIAILFGVDVRTVNEHLKNIYRQGELTKEATIRKFRTVQAEGSRQVTREIELKHARTKRTKERRIQPERYAKYAQNILEYILTKHRNSYKKL